jgi:transcriptional regulator with XRE-family HTH domain
MRVKRSKNLDDIGARLREVRIENRLTQKEMAKIISMTPGSVGALENNLYTPNYDVLRLLKKRLHVSYDYLLDGEKGDNVFLRQENEHLKKEVARLTKIVDKLLK